MGSHLWEVLQDVDLSAENVGEMLIKVVLNLSTTSRHLLEHECEEVHESLECLEIVNILIHVFDLLEHLMRELSKNRDDRVEQVLRTDVAHLKDRGNPDVKISQVSYGLQRDGRGYYVPCTLRAVDGVFFGSK